MKDTYKELAMNIDDRFIKYRLIDTYSKGYIKTGHQVQKESIPIYIEDVLRQMFKISEETGLYNVDYSSYGKKCDSQIIKMTDDGEIETPKFLCICGESYSLPEIIINRLLQTETMQVWMYAMAKRLGHERTIEEAKLFILRHMIYIVCEDTNSKKLIEKNLFGEQDKEFLQVFSNCYTREEFNETEVDVVIGDVREDDLYYMQRFTEIKFKRAIFINSGKWRSTGVEAEQFKERHLHQIHRIWLYHRDTGYPEVCELHTNYTGVSAKVIYRYLRNKSNGNDLIRQLRLRDMFAAGKNFEDYITKVQ